MPINRLIHPYVPIFFYLSRTLSALKSRHFLLPESRGKNGSAHLIKPLANYDRLEQLITRLGNFESWKKLHYVAKTIFFPSAFILFEGVKCTKCARFAQRRICKRPCVDESVIASHGVFISEFMWLLKV